MQQSKILISQALSTLKSNMQRTGDPLGFKKPYWIDWADEQDLPQQGNTTLLTARMYQMLPYVLQATDLVETARPFLPLLSWKIFGKMAHFGNALAGETIMRLKAKSAMHIKEKGERALKGITAALRQVGECPSYLYEEEPYSGVLLYDLGLEEEIAPHIRNVGQRLTDNGIKQVLTVDPHTTFMLKEIYPKHLSGQDIKVNHYLDILADRSDKLKANKKHTLPKEFVMHDSCVMTRDLDIIEQARKLMAGMGIKLVEPENNRKNTACCGGPIEYAYGDLSGKISNIRIQELASVCKNILVTCPICLINFSKYEKDLGIRVWDMGELLHEALN